MIWGRWGEGKRSQSAGNAASTEGQQALGSLEAGWGSTQLQIPTKTKRTRQGGVDVRDPDGCRIYRFGVDLFELRVAEHTPPSM